MDTFFSAWKVPAQFFSLSEFFKCFAVEYVSQSLMRLMENPKRQAYSWILSATSLMAS